MRLPDGATQVEPPPLTLDEVPGATLVFHSAWQLPGGRLMVACATRPVPLWFDGLGPAVFGGMNGMVRRHLSLREMKPGDTSAQGVRQVQAFSGAGQSAVVGRHEVGFADAGTLLACTAACQGDAPACGQALAALEMAPGFVDREATYAERALTAALTHPRASVIVVTLMLVCAAVVLLARRPSEALLAARRKKRA